jgi:gas vesicle protein
MEDKMRYGECMNAGGGFFIGLLTGAVIGGVVALLFAPQTGTETREMVRDKVRDRIEQMKEMYCATKCDVSKTAEQMKSNASDMEGMI